MQLSKSTVTVRLTISKEVRNRLRDLASETDRTMSGYILWVLHDHLWKLEQEEQKQ